MREEVEKEKEEGTSPEAVRCWGGGGFTAEAAVKHNNLKKKKNLIKLSGFTNSTSHYIRRLSDVIGVIVSKTAGLMSVNASVTLHCPNFHVIVCFVLFFPACVQL